MVCPKVEQLTQFVKPTFISGPRPINARAGELRFNTDANQMESFDGTNWHRVYDGNPGKLKITTGKDRFGECEYWVEATPSGLFSERRERNNEIDEWVYKTYGPKTDWGYGRWCSSDSRYWFKEEKDRDWFVLRWTE